MKSVGKHLAWTLVSSVGVLGVNFATGVMVCRVLEPDGRGRIAAISTWTQIIGWAAAMGFYESFTYLRARNAADPRRLLGSGVLLTFLLGTLGVVAAELLLPYGFRAQSPQVLSLARLWMFTIYFAIASSMVNAMITGDQQFGILNLTRFVQPLIYLAGLLVLYVTGRFSVIGVLALAAGSDLLITGILFVRLIVTSGIGLPSMSLIREGLQYGLRVQGALFANLANSRLDMMLLPAVLQGTAQIGLYSVSTNLSGLIVNLLGSFAIIIFPAATRAGSRDGMRLVARSLRLVFFGGLAGATLMGFACPMLLQWVYGPKFNPAVPSLLMLLPGAVAMACTKIVDGGLQSVNHPMKATWAQLVGLAITLVGLYLTLEPLGIVGAALTSSVSYTASFLVSLYFLARVPEFSVREAFSLAALRDDMASIASRVRERFLPTPLVSLDVARTDASLDPIT